MPPPYHYQNEPYGPPPPSSSPRYYPRNSMRMAAPPSRYHEQYQAPPPPPSFYRAEPGYGPPPPPPGPWREESQRQISSYSPRYDFCRDLAPHSDEQRHYQVPRGPLPGLYMPHMHQPSTKKEGPPPARMNSRRAASLSEPQFKRRGVSPTHIKTTNKNAATEVKKPTHAAKDSKGKKKGDALDLLAKVSSAMTEDEESEGGTEASDKNLEPPACQQGPEHSTPPRPHFSSPPKSHLYTPRTSHAPERYAIRQITPSTDQRRPPYMDNYPPRLHHREHYASLPPREFYPPPYYSSSHSPPAVISQRNSFEEGMGLGQEVVYYEGGSTDLMEIDSPHHGAYEHYPSRPEQYPSHLPPPPLPYTFVQQPRLENKTILRKKFSWKHYPEVRVNTRLNQWYASSAPLTFLLSFTNQLERFLIANRDEYLRHSALNYTAEQKQYNNWLTERLLELAARHHYIFDTEEFNFVAVRDRIRRSEERRVGKEC